VVGEWPSSILSAHHAREPSQLASLGELFGGVGVIVSLFYVAYQIKQNTRALRGTTAQAAEESFAQLNERYSYSRENYPLYLKVFRDNCSWESLSDEEQISQTFMARAVMQRISGQYHLYCAGLLEKGIWECRIDWASKWVRGYPAISAWWEIEKRASMFDTEFIDVIDSYEIPQP